MTRVVRLHYWLVQQLWLAQLSNGSLDIINIQIAIYYTFNFQFCHIIQRLIEAVELSLGTWGPLASGDFGALEGKDFLSHPRA